MPAPVPVEILHGNPSVLGQLALDAGRSRFQRESNDAQIARDMAFINQQFERQQQADSDKQQYMLGVEQLAADEAEEDRAFALQNTLAERRFASQEGMNKARIASQQDIADRRIKSATSNRNPRSTPFSRAVEYAASQGGGGGSGYIRSDQGEHRFNDGQGAFLPAVSDAGGGGYGQEMIDPATGRIDFSKFPMSTQYTPGENEMRRGGFVGSTPQETEGVGEIQSQLDYLSRLQGQLPPEQFEALRKLARTGQLTTQQLVNEVQQAAKSDTTGGLTPRDIEYKIMQLRGSKAMSPYLDVQENIQGEIDLLTKQLREKRTNPMGGRSITTNPNPSPNGRQLTPELTDQFLDAATGPDGTVDEYLAESKAREAGYTF